jgi:hypothetical protein
VLPFIPTYPRLSHYPEAFRNISYLTLVERGCNWEVDGWLDMRCHGGVLAGAASAVAADRKALVHAATLACGVMGVNHCQFSGQQHEDASVFALFFAQQPRGTYVEVGAFNGRDYSNTLLFEHLGWSGVLVEAEISNFALLQRHRGGITCLAQATGTVTACDLSACLEYGKRDADCCGFTNETQCASGYKKSCAPSHVCYQDSQGTRHATCCVHDSTLPFTPPSPPAGQASLHTSPDSSRSDDAIIDHRCHAHIPWRNRRWQAAVCARELAHSKQVFVGQGAVGGLVASMSPQHQKRWIGTQVTGSTVDCVTLAEILRQSGVSVVDFMSLDIEGGELDALSSIDWHQVTIRVLLVERNNRDVEIERLLLSVRMSLVREIGSNRLWAHESVLPLLHL